MAHVWMAGALIWGKSKSRVWEYVEQHPFLFAFIQVYNEKSGSHQPSTLNR